jgi:hypothetical protein
MKRICEKPTSLGFDTRRKNQHPTDRRDGGIPMEPFDLIEMQKQAREIYDPRKLFELWEEICRRYERGEIGEYELEEMKEVIWPTLRQLASLRRAMNNEPSRRQRRRKTG